MELIECLGLKVMTPDLRLGEVGTLELDFVEVLMYVSPRARAKRRLLLERSMRLAFAPVLVMTVRSGVEREWDRELVRRCENG